MHFSKKRPNSLRGFLFSHHEKLCMGGSLSSTRTEIPGALKNFDTNNCTIKEIFLTS